MKLSDSRNQTWSGWLCLMCAVAALAVAGCKGSTDTGGGSEPTAGAAGSDTNAPATNAPAADAGTNATPASQ